MNGFEKALDMLPEKFRTAAAAFKAGDAEEIRLRTGRKPTVLSGGREHSLDCPEVTGADISRILEKVTGASLHSAEASLMEGYINFEGLRIGVCGRAVIYKSELKTFTDFSSLNIRIPREYKGICRGLIDEIYSGGFKNTLLISPPGFGKTTALREIIRVQSERGSRIGVIDDRNELSACYGGKFHFDLGPHSDILVSAPKYEAAMMLLKGMNEEIIAMDEVSSVKDIEALSRICGCGVGILASAHAGSRDELYKRPLYRRLMDMNIFTFLISIRLKNTGRAYRAERL